PARQFNSEMRESMRSRERDRALPRLRILEAARPELGHGDGERVPRLDHAVKAQLAQRALEPLARAGAHAAGSAAVQPAPNGAGSASATSPPSTFNDPERKQRRSSATRAKPAPRTASRSAAAPRGSSQRSSSSGVSSTRARSPW